MITSPITKFKKTLLLLTVSAALSGCSTVTDLFDSDDDRPPLEGERISVLELADALEPTQAALEAYGLVMPPPWKNEFWPQTGGYPNHAMQNLHLSENELSRIWKADIGTGANDELPLTAQPILVDGKIYTLDTHAQLSAFDINTGQSVWRIDTAHPEENDPVIGGGLAYSGGVLYLTNGYKEILAVIPTDGEILWRKTLPAPSRAAPTVMDGRIFTLTLDNRLIAMDARTGEQLWSYESLAENAGLVGAASPAASRDIVVAAFSSGDIAALRVQNGSTAWTGNLSPLKRFGGLSPLSDIKAPPVIDRGVVFAASFGGRLVAIDAASGRRIWQKEIGSTNMPWVAGNYVFVLSTDNQLVAFARENGHIAWVTKIQNNSKEKLYFAGPVLAGGRLFVVGSSGVVVEANPETGKIIRQWDAGDQIRLAPIIAGGTMYILSDNGTLSAYR